MTSIRSTSKLLVTPTPVDPGLPNAPTGMKPSRCVAGELKPRNWMYALPERSPGWFATAVALESPLPEEKPAPAA